VLVGFSDPAAGGVGVNHHHWNPLFPLYPGNGVANDETAGSPLASAGKPFPNVAFDAYSAWDQRGNNVQHRNGDAVMHFGHGYINEAVPYRFAGGVPAAARADLNAAVAGWVAAANGLFAIDPFGAGTGRVFGMNFAPHEDANGNGMLDAGEDTDGDTLLDVAEDVNFNGMLDMGEDLNGNGAMDGFTVTWSAGALPVRARWKPGSQELEFDSTEAWFFGGAGAIPANEDINGNGMLDAGEDLNGSGGIDAVTDFVTIALHELGHMIGLNHINSNEDLNGNGILNVGEDLDGDGVLDINPGSLMDTNIDLFATPGVAGMMGVRTPDVASQVGALALYTQPVPEPSAGFLTLLGSLACAGCRRRYGPRC